MSTDDLKTLREVLAGLDPRMRKPWRQLDGMPYLHATDDPNANPWDAPVVGRFAYLPAMPYVAACHPERITRVVEAAEEAERLRAALTELIASTDAQDDLRLSHPGVRAMMDASYVIEVGERMDAAWANARAAITAGKPSP
jgi:hypothetical protein